MSSLNKSLVLLLILTVAAANAPNTIDAFIDSTPSSSQVWNKTFGGTGAEWAFSVIQTFDGGYATAGYTTSSGAGKADAWLVKTDSLGNQEWNKTYGGINQDYAASVIQTIDGGYALAGIKGAFNDGGYSLAVYRDLIILGNADAWLIKTDSSGNQLWNRTYGGLNDDGAFSIVQTLDGGYAMAGNTYSFSAGNNTDIWLIKTDSSGNELWNRPFGGPKDDFGYSVIQTSDGGYALAGITNSSGAGYEDVWLIKTDSSGNKQWDKTYGGALDDEAYCVMQTEDGGYTLAGSTLCCGAGVWDAWLIKIDSSGNNLWNQTYGGTGDDQFISMIMSSDGGLVLSGSTNTFGAGYWDAWLVKVSSVAQNPAQANVS